MNEIVTNTANLPANIEDLSKFVLVGREKLTAVRAEIRAIKKVGLAKEVHEQKLREAQDIAEAVLDAEVRIGELTKKMQTAPGQRTDLKPDRNSAERLTTKAERLAEIGIKPDTAERYEALANHREVVEAVKAEARETNDIVTRQAVLRKIAESAPKHEIKTAQKVAQDARMRHEQFKANKEESVVSVHDIRVDKTDRNIIARSMYTEIWDCIRKINQVAAFNESATINDILECYPSEEIKDTVKHLRDSVSILSILIEKLNRR